jgi:hypothetical protein
MSVSWQKKKIFSEKIKKNKIPLSLFFFCVFDTKNASFFLLVRLIYLTGGMGERKEIQEGGTGKFVVVKLISWPDVCRRNIQEFNDKKYQTANGVF